MKLTTIFATAAAIFTAWKMLDAYNNYRLSKTSDSQTSPTTGSKTQITARYSIAAGEPTPATEAAFNTEPTQYVPAYRDEEYIGLDPEELYLEGVNA